MKRRSKGCPLEIHVQDVSCSASVPEPSDIRTWVQRAFGDQRGGSLTVRIVGDDEGARFNERYRRGRGATNVLAFPPGDTLLPESDEAPPLGDLMICAPVLEREADEQGKALEAHWAHVSIHGALHLVGYDHETAEDARVMEARERELLRALGFDDLDAGDL